MVSPRKRAIGIRSLRSSPPSKNSKSSTPDDWISGTNFLFAESPIIPRREFKGGRPGTGKGAKPKTSADAKTRRHSVLLKRLDLPVNSFGTSPVSNMRKTRRQSIAVSASSRSLSALKPPEVPKPTSPKLKRNSRSAAAMLPPKKAAPAKVEKSFSSPVKSMSVSESVTQCSVSHSPLKFYSSPTKHPKGLTHQTSIGSAIGKRKAESDVTLIKVESTPKKMKVELSESKVSPLKKVKKALQSPSPVGKKKLRSGIPLRSVRSEESLALPLEKSKSPKKESKVTSKSPKKDEKKEKLLDSPRKSKTVSASKVVSPKSPKNSPKKLREPVVKTTKTPDLKKKKSVESLKKVKTPKVKKSATPKLKKKGKSVESPDKIKSPKGKKVDSPEPQKDEVAKAPKKPSPVAKEAETPVGKSPKKQSSAKKAATPKPLRQKEISVNSPRKLRTPSVKKVATPKSQQKKGNKKKSNMTSPKGDTKKPSEKVSSPQKKNAEIVSDAQLLRESVSPQSKKPQEKASTDSPKKALAKKSKGTPAKKSVKISTPASVKRLQSSLETLEVIERSTRSSARSSRRVRLVGESPRNLPSSYRKTPKSKQKSSPKITDDDDDDDGASPVLSARHQLEFIRCRSPLKFKSSIAESKVKPYTPKPDPLPSNVLRKTLKKRVAQKLQATTKVEVHQLMNGEISRPVALVTGSKTTTTTASVTVTHSKFSNGGSAVITITPRKALSRNVCSGLQSNSVTARTPVSLSNLPPTPTSSRKREGFLENSRTITSRKTNVVSCQRALSTTTPRSSTPIEEDEVNLKLLNVDSIIQKESNFTDDSIDTDQSEDESSKLSEEIEEEIPTPEKPKKSYCSLM